MKKLAIALMLGAAAVTASAQVNYTVQTAGMQTAVPAARIFRRPAVMYRRRPRAPGPVWRKPRGRP